MQRRTAFTVATTTARFAPDPAGLLERVIDRARGDAGIHGLVLLGSRARTEHPADTWSDTDLLVLVDDPEAFLAEAGWPMHLGVVSTTFLESTHGRRERRVLFADGTDLDMIPVGVDELASVVSEAADVLARGHRVVLDKDGLLEDLSERVARAIAQRRDDWPPSLVAFENLVADFWYHAVWTARKLRRGELWVALGCLDGYMKRRLLTIIEWQARARGDGQADAWIGGRFLERWADPETVEALRGAFAHYEAPDVSRALRATMDLFRRLALDLSIRLELPYPERADDAATGMVNELLD